MSSDFLHKPPIFLGQDRLPSRFQDQLDTLAREKDPELYFHGLLNLGRELKGHLQEEKALAVFQSLLSEEKLPEEIRKNATLESEAILGQGSVGMRLEQLGSRFFQDAGRWNSASMRPQHFAAEEERRLRARLTSLEASMRPQHFAAEESKEFILTYSSFLLQ